MLLNQTQPASKIHSDNTKDTKDDHRIVSEGVDSIIDIDTSVLPPNDNKHSESDETAQQHSKPKYDSSDGNDKDTINAQHKSDDEKKKDDLPESPLNQVIYLYINCIQICLFIYLLNVYMIYRNQKKSM